MILNISFMMSIFYNTTTGKYLEAVYGDKYAIYWHNSPDNSELVKQSAEWCFTISAKFQ